MPVRHKLGQSKPFICDTSNVRSLVVNSISLFNDLCDLPANARKRNTALLFVCSAIVATVTTLVMGGVPVMKNTYVVVA